MDTNARPAKTLSFAVQFVLPGVTGIKDKTITQCYELPFALKVERDSTLTMAILPHPSDIWSKINTVASMPICADDGTEISRRFAFSYSPAYPSNVPITIEDNLVNDQLKAIIEMPAFEAESFQRLLNAVNRYNAQVTLYRCAWNGLLNARTKNGSPRYPLKFPVLSVSNLHMKFPVLNASHLHTEPAELPAEITITWSRLGWDRLDLANDPHSVFLSLTKDLVNPFKMKDIPLRAFNTKTFTDLGAIFSIKIATKAKELIINDESDLDKSYPYASSEFAPKMTLAIPKNVPKSLFTDISGLARFLGTEEPAASFSDFPDWARKIYDLAHDIVQEYHRLSNIITSPGR